MALSVLLLTFTQTINKWPYNIEVNLNNVLIMVGDFNIRNNNWNPSYPHHSTYADILREIADLFNLEICQV